MYSLSGIIFDGSTLIEGYLEVEDGSIVKIGRGSPCNEPVAKGVIVPTLWNGHVHLGDAFIKEPPPRDLAEAVRPPDGWKHRMLAKASEGEVVSGIEEALFQAFEGGTCRLIDFREGGERGLRLLDAAGRPDGMEVMALGRPSGLEYDEAEVEGLLDQCDGIGASAISDWPYEELMELSRACRARGKVFALHASEGEREDIDRVLDLDPTFVVHMCAATDGDLELCMEAGVAIVSCPSSNAHFGLRPVLGRALEMGASVILGTDNAMISGPSVGREVGVARDLEGGIHVEELMGMVTSNPRKTFNGGDGISVEEGKTVDIAVYPMSGGRDPVRALGKRPLLIARGKRSWRHDNGVVQEDTDTD